MTDDVPKVHHGFYTWSFKGRRNQNIEKVLNISCGIKYNSTLKVNVKKNTEEVTCEKCLAEIAKFNAEVARELAEFEVIRKRYNFLSG